MYRKKRGISLHVLGLLLAMLLTGLAGRYIIIKLYPLQYEGLVVAEAEANGISPELVAAVIRVESRFDSHAQSPRGAVGLMQLTPDTAAWIAERLGESNFTEKQLLEPAANIRLGTAYLAYLIDLFSGDVELALAAYNGGHSNVQEWLKMGAWTGEIDQVKDIPFPETRDFVNRVISSQQIYQRLYHSRLDAS